MIDIKFRECCFECEELNTYVDENKMYTSGVDFPFVVAKTVAIGCSHEKVCGLYNKEEQK